MPRVLQATTILILDTFLSSNSIVYPTFFKPLHHLPILYLQLRNARSETTWVVYWLKGEEAQVHNLPHHPYIVGVANSCGDWLHWTTCKPFKKEGEKKKLASSFHLQVQLAFLIKKLPIWNVYKKNCKAFFFIKKKKQKPYIHYTV